MSYVFVVIYAPRERRPSNIRLSCERACPVSPLEPVVYAQHGHELMR